MVCYLPCTCPAGQAYKARITPLPRVTNEPLEMRWYNWAFVAVVVAFLGWWLIVPAIRDNLGGGGGTRTGGRDLDCSDFAGPVIIDGSDPHGLDRDGDGIGCEAN